VTFGVIVQKYYETNKEANEDHCLLSSMEYKQYIELTPKSQAEFKDPNICAWQIED